MRMYDNVLEHVCDIVRDDEDIRLAFKNRFDNSGTAGSIQAKKMRVEEDQKWLKKFLMWMSSGPSKLILFEITLAP